LQQSALPFLIRATAGQPDELFAQPIFVPESQGGFPQALSVINGSQLISE